MKGNVFFFWDGFKEGRKSKCMEPNYDLILYEIPLINFVFVYECILILLMEGCNSAPSCAFGTTTKSIQIAHSVSKNQLKFSTHQR